VAQQITYSAKFKRDYVAASAVVIFIAIVLAEIALAISIPAYLKRENAMALEVRRLQLLDSFDGARGMSEKLKPKGGETAEALDIDEEFGLVVRRPDGAVKTVRSGEVSVRGLYGYTE
jgi:hypothetical protein